MKEGELLSAIECNLSDDTIVEMLASLLIEALVKCGEEHKSLIGENRLCCVVERLSDLYRGHGHPPGGTCSEGKDKHMDYANTSDDKNGYSFASEQNQGELWRQSTR
jgi:hypothetical protein